MAWAQTAGREWTAPSLFCQITDKSVNESSGLGASRRYVGEYYTHNDSGDSARFFRFDRTGKLTAEFNLPGVKARDWEDMEVATVKGKNMVFLGDIGDNASVYPTIKIYRFEEPTGNGGEVTKFDTIEATYPGGARNAEALMVDPATGDIWIVEKRQGQGGIFRLRNPRGSGKYKFEYMGKIEFPDGLGPMRLITGGSVAPDGKSLVLRTYAFAYEFKVPGRDFKSWLTGKAKRIQTALEVQGEAIAYDLSGDRLFTTSEGTPCRVSTMQAK